MLALYHAYVSISGPNFNPNQASIFNSVNRNTSNLRSDKLKLKDNRVNGEIVDVDYRSVSSDDKDESSSNDSNKRLAYQNSIYARVLDEPDSFKSNRKDLSESSKKEENFLDDLSSKLEITSSPREKIEREVDKEIAKKLDQINDRLARIESKLGIDEGDLGLANKTSNSYRINPDFNASYSKHKRDYSSMIPGLEMHNLKRKWNA
jgi:hypothetical protein